MNEPTGQLERLVRAAHRRMVAVRVLEGIGMGLLGGCMAAGVVVGVLVWRGQPAVSQALVVLAVGAAMGLVRALWRPPGRLAAAMETDRQLRLDDLLATAWAMRGRPVPDWQRECAAAVRASAERASRERSASQLSLARLSGRAWGGIGLATAAVLAAAVLLGEATAGGSREVAGQFLTGRQTAELRYRLDAAPDGSAAWQRPASDRQVGDADNPVDGEVPLHGGIAEQPGTADDAQLAGAAATEGGVGGGVGRSPQVDQDLTGQQISAAAGSEDPDGIAAAGAGASQMSDGESGADLGASAAGAADSRGAAAPWRSLDWPADRSAALEAVRRGSVPDRHAELVRRYFDRE